MLLSYAAQMCAECVWVREENTWTDSQVPGGNLDGSKWDHRAIVEKLNTVLTDYDASDYARGSSGGSGGIHACKHAFPRFEGARSVVTVNM